MRNAETILNVIRERGRRGLPLERIYRLLFNRDLYLRAYGRVNKIRRKYQKTMPTPHGAHKVLEVIHGRGPGKQPLVARFGGIELCWQKGITLNEHPKDVFSHRSEVVQRLLAQECELCGSTEQCEVHHIRQLADLDKDGQKPKQFWVKRMAARRRKTRVVCRDCHEAIHRECASKQQYAA